MHHADVMRRRDGERTGHERHVGAAAPRGGRDRDAHLAAAYVREEANGIECLACWSGGDEHSPARERTARLEHAPDVREDRLRLRHAPGARALVR